VLTLGTLIKNSGSLISTPDLELPIVHFPISAGRTLLPDEPLLADDLILAALQITQPLRLVEHDRGDVPALVLGSEGLAEGAVPAPHHGLRSPELEQVATLLAELGLPAELH
jgi:hypothetical protein